MITKLFIMIGILQFIEIISMSKSFLKIIHQWNKPAITFQKLKASFRIEGPRDMLATIWTARVMVGFGTVSWIVFISIAKYLGMIAQPHFILYISATLVVGFMNMRMTTVDEFMRLLMTEEPLNPWVRLFQQIIFLAILISGGFYSVGPVGWLLGL